MTVGVNLTVFFLRLTFRTTVDFEQTFAGLCAKAQGSGIFVSSRELSVCAVTEFTKRGRATNVARPLLVHPAGLEPTTMASEAIVLSG